MSIWNKVKQTKYRDFSHWPNPFPSVQEVTPMACSPNQLVLVKMWGLAALHWWFDAFVPSPTELVRKTLTGSYKCGFFLGGELPSPLDVIWEDGRTSQALMEISRPVTTALFAMWATQTAFAALDAAHTLYLAMEKCEEDQNEGVMADGAAYFASDHDIGGTPFYTTLWDPKGRAEPIDGAFGFPIGPMSASAFGTVSCAAGFITNVRASLIAGGHSYNQQDLGGCGPGGHVSYSLSMGATMLNAGAIQVRLEITQTGAGPFTTEAITKRFIIHYNQIDPDRANLQFPQLPNPCTAAGMPPFSG